jgi:hypothetical protein
VPDHCDISEDLRPYIGQSIKQFYDKILTKRFRDSVAHYVLKENTILHVSSPTELAAFASVSFVSELCARILIKNHEDLLLSLSRGQPSVNKSFCINSTRTWLAPFQQTTTRYPFAELVFFDHLALVFAFPSAG